MTCHQALPASGSMAAHDALGQAFVGWRLAQEACEADHDNAQAAAFADFAWARLTVHANNCGYEAKRHGALVNWSARRVSTFARSLGVSEQVILSALGEHTAALSSEGH